MTAKKDGVLGDLPVVMLIQFGLLDGILAVVTNKAHHVDRRSVEMILRA